MAFKFKDEESKRDVSVNCHRFVLASRSPLFADEFKLSSASKTIEITGTSIKAFKTLIEYLYLDDLTIIDKHAKECDVLVEILKLSKKHKLSALLEKCE